jgi:endoglucanase
MPPLISPGARGRRARPWRYQLLGCCLGALALALVSLGCGSNAAATPAKHRLASRASEGRLASLRLYLGPNTPAAQQSAAWRADGLTREAQQIEQIAREPTATWLTGGTQSVKVVAGSLVAAASRAGATATLVLYNIPDRDCHGYSSGGAATPAAYRTWIAQVVRAIGRHPVIVILEPDSIDQAAGGCLNAAEAQARYGLLAGAVQALQADPGAHVYLDAGNAAWLSPSQIASPLRESGIAHAAGFSLNVANFQTASVSVAYGRQLSQVLGGAHFVVDTGRSGAGPPHGAPGVHAWCNPSGRAIGPAPTTNTGLTDVDAYLWVKYPGESDGACGPGDPPAGTWWPSYGLALVQRAESIQHALREPGNGLTTAPPG